MTRSRARRRCIPIENDLVRPLPRRRWCQSGARRRGEARAASDRPGFYVVAKTTIPNMRNRGHVSAITRPWTRVHGWTKMHNCWLDYIFLSDSNAILVEKAGGNGCQRSRAEHRRLDPLPRRRQDRRALRRPAPAAPPRADRFQPLGRARHLLVGRARARAV